ncbi:dihydrodipicolinate synthase/N-acetylneuraminate lyase [Bradyrhizobium diazoefficiens]
MPVTPHHKAQRPYRGVFPVAPTIFDERGELDLEGQRRCIDFMIDAGSTSSPISPSSSCSPTPSAKP